MKHGYRANRLMAHLFSERIVPMSSEDSFVSADDTYLRTLSATRSGKGGEATEKQSTTSEKPRNAVQNDRSGLFI